MNGGPPRGARDVSGASSMRSRLSLLIGDRRGSIAALSTCSIISGFTEAGTLAVIAQVASSLIKGAKHVDAHIGPLDVHASLGTLLEVAFALTLLRILLQVPLSILPARIVADVQAGMRRRLFDAFSRASWGMQSRDREGQLQETMTNQVNQATAGAAQTTMLITASITFLVLMGSALALNPLGAVVVAFTSTALFGLLRPLRRRVVRNSRALSKAQVSYAGDIAESIRVAEETHVFGVAAAQRERVERSVQTYNRLFFRREVLSKLAGKLYESLISVLLVAAVGGLYLAGGGQSASLGAVILLLLRGGTAGQAVQGAYQGLAQSLPFIERTQETMRRYIESRPEEGVERLARVDTLAFENVSFAYNPGSPVLSDLTFQVDAGEVIGIIGPSGAGKSTLVQLLLQLRTPDGGRYLVNGVSADAFVRDDWHKQVAYVPQEPRLLHASVADNIRFFRDIDDEAVQRAGQLARIHEDIVGWKNGYETIIGPRADAVSGGQQQRICLARALAARPEVLVLDEPTSALDPHSETLIGESLSSLKHELTLFIIAHRMSTLDICDRVMVIVDGRLVAFDTKALLQRENTYYRHASEIAARASTR
jgi:ABC-type multidrug transport system fused ATPase/permease subunit